MKTRINNVNIVYYSPTCTSQKIARAIGDGLRCEHLNEYNITKHDVNVEIKEDSLTVFVFPVYAGRIARTALERIKDIKGNNSLAVIAVVYGNRHYDDALLELRNEITNKGFIPVAGATFIGEHSFSRKDMPVAAGRPDHYDIGMAEHFGKEVMDKISSVKEFTQLNVPGNYPYKELKPSPMIAPTCTDDCSVCGTCIDLCPTSAIHYGESGEIVTDVEKCTLCCACVKGCPSNARIFETPFTKMLFENFSTRRNPEFFF